MHLAPLLCALLAAAGGPQEGARVERHESPFGPVFVVDQGRERLLRFGDPEGADQSVIDLRDPRAAPVEYVRAATLGLAYAARVEHAVVVGMGAGVLSRALVDALPRARVDSVEINPVVAHLARARFGLRPHPRHFVVVDDGARYLEALARADLIVLDAYQGDDLPTALSTPAFFARVADLVADGGVVILNVAVEDAELERRLTTRFALAFARCDAVRVDEGNLVLFGAPARVEDPDGLDARAAALDARGALPWRVTPFARARVPCDEVEAEL